MKKTKYFITPGHQAHDLGNAIKDCEQKRDLFLSENENLIATVEAEDIKINYYSGNMNSVSVVIQLTYYLKES
jgi:hypothetical protein